MEGQNGKIWKIMDFSSIDAGGEKSPFYGALRRCGVVHHETTNAPKMGLYGLLRRC